MEQTSLLALLALEEQELDEIRQQALDVADQARELGDAALLDQANMRRVHTLVASALAAEASGAQPHSESR